METKPWLYFKEFIHHSFLVIWKDLRVNKYTTKIFYSLVIFSMILPGSFRIVPGMHNLEDIQVRTEIALANPDNQSLPYSRPEITRPEPRIGTRPSDIDTEVSTTSLADTKSSARPLLFVENVGQFDPNVKYQMMSGGNIVRFTKDSVWFTLFEPKEEEKEFQFQATATPTPVPPSDSQTNNDNPHIKKGVHIKLEFAGSNPDPMVEGFGPSNTVISYFLGDNPEKWKSNVPVWEGIRYKNIYPGTDLEITSIEGNWNWELKFTDESTFSSFNNPEGYDFIFNGQDQLEISDNNIILTTQVGSVVLPVMGVGTTECSANLLSDYVMIENRVNVYTSLAPENWETGSGLDGPSMNNVDPVGFSPTLVTETSSSFYSTFLGGSASETGFGITVDESGNAYVVGQTYSTDFPHTYGSFNGGHSDMFITKINQGGSDIYFSTFIGGSSSDCYSNCSIVVDENGESYIVGDTISLTFPTTETALDRTFNDGFNPYSSDGYVIKLNVLGDSLLYSSYLGGSSDDIGYGIDLYAGYIYVTGMTDSSNFPTTAGAYIMVKKPYQDIFVSKLDLSLSGFASLIYSTFVGGNSSDQGHDIDVLNGYAYVTGQTLSTDFPAVNAFDASHNGEWDSIIFKLNQSGTGLEYSTYLGGSSNDCEIAGNSQECSIAVDWNGYAYVTGLTLSSNFPTYHALDSTMGGTDAYIAKLNQNGNALIYSTFLGGSSSDVSNAIEVDDSGYTYIVGSTWSSDFPTTNGAFDQNYWNVEAFILKLPSDGSRVLYASFFGGSGDDFGYGLCLVDSMGIGGVIFTGSTSSSDFPLSTQAYDSSYSGSSDAFISKLFILNINSVPDSAIRTGCTVKNSVPECPKIATYDDSQGAAGDPINTRTGGFDYSVVGMSIPTSAGLLKFQRYYSSLSTEVFTDTLGYGWTHNLDSYLIFPADPLGEENKIIYKANSGNFYKFIDNSDGTFSAEPGVLITLTKVQVPTIHYQVVDTEQNVYTFDDIGRIVRREDPQGHYWSYIYTGEQLTQVVDDTNLKYLSLTYFPQGKLQSVVDHTGRGISFDYDLAGDLTLFVDTLNKETTYSYDNFHRLRIVTDPAQKVVVHNEYDIQGRSYQQFDPDGTLILTVNYDLSSTTITNSLNEVDTHNYDDRNTLVSISEEPGSDVNRTYDYNFRIIKEIDENDQPIRMTWSTYGANLRRVVDALENQTDLTYDDINNLTSIIDPRAYLTTFEYDGTLLTGETNALFETTIYTYTTSTDYPQPAGLLKAVQDPLGNVTHYAYDEFGQRTSITDASNQSTTFAYDLLGRLTKTTYHNGQTDWTCYDAADRIVRTVINATGDGSLPQSDPCDAVNYQSSPQPGYDRITTTVYDDSGNVIATIDTDGIINRTYYNADLRPATSIQNLVGQTIENPVPPPYDPLYPNQNIRTDTYYDSEGNVIAVEDTLGRITRTYYDSQNRPQYIVQNLTGQAIEVNTPPAYDPSYPDQNISSETVYDPVGNAIASIDTLSRITRTYYDELNRPKYVVQNLVGQDISNPTSPSYNPEYPDQNILTEYVYDESGNTIAVINILGRIQRTYYDALNRPETVVENLYGQGISPETLPVFDPNYPDRNLLTDYIYDAAGNQIAVVDPAGIVTRTYFDSLNRPVTVVQNLTGWAIDNPIAPSYNPAFPDQNVRTDTAYDYVGNAIATIDTLGRVTRTYYDTLNRPYLIVRNLYPADIENPVPPSYDPLFPDRNVRTETVYDGEGKTIATIANDGVITRTYYDILDRAYMIVQNLYGQSIDVDTPPTYDPNFPDRNVRTETIYGPGGNAQKTVGPTGQNSYSCYDGVYRVVKTIVNPSIADPCGSYIPSSNTDEDIITQNTFDGLGNLVSTIDPNSNETTYIYDSLNRLVTEIDPLLHTTSFAYDGLGNQIFMTNAKGVTTRYEYDQVGRLTAVTENDRPGETPSHEVNVRTEYTYGAAGNRRTIKDALNHITTFGYDALNRLTGEQDALNHLSTYEYDGVGNRTAVVDANGVTITYLYDELNRLLTIDYPEPQADVTLTYDESGNRHTMSDGLGTTTWVYDDLQRPLSITDPFTGITQYQYDGSGHKTSLTYPDTKVVIYDYDEVGRLSLLTDWSSQSSNYTYDKGGRIQTIYLPSGLSTAYDYDGSDRVLSILHQQGTNTLSSFYYRYDEVGNRVRALETVFPSISGLSELHSPASQAGQIGGDNNGFETNPENALVDDGLFAVDNSSGTNSLYDCLDAGKDRHEFYNLNFDIGEGSVIHGIEVSLDAKADSTRNTPKMCVQLSWDGGQTWTAAQSTPTLSTSEARYLLGGGTNTWGRSWNAGEFNNGNFKVRLTNVASSKSRDFFLDWVSVKLYFDEPPKVYYAYDPLNRLTGANDNDGDYFHYSYDAVGNRLAETTPSGTTAYGYDIANRLASVDGVSYTWDNNGNLLDDGANTYTYDHANRLTGVTGTGLAASYVYNGLGDRLREVINGQTTDFTMDLNSGLTQVLSDGTYTYLYGHARLGQESAAGMAYYLSDALGSVRQLADASSITLSRAYEPYGEVQDSSGSGTTSYGFTGEWTDDYAKLLYLRSRWYAPQTGGFITKDIWYENYTNPISFNKWIYGFSNPVNNTDPSGKSPIHAVYRPPGLCPKPNPSQDDPNAPTFLIDGDERYSITFIYCGEFKLTSYGFIQDKGYSGGVNEKMVTSTDGKLKLPLGLALDIQMNGTGYSLRNEVLAVCNGGQYISKLRLSPDQASFTYACKPGKYFVPVSKYIEKVAAADLTILPLDSIIYLPKMCGSGTGVPCYNGAYRAYIKISDTGGRIIGNRLDIFAGMGPGEHSIERGSSALYQWLHNHSYLGNTSTQDGSDAVGPTPVYQLVSDEIMNKIIQSLICQ